MFRFSGKCFRDEGYGVLGDGFVFEDVFRVIWFVGDKFEGCSLFDVSCSDHDEIDDPERVYICLIIKRYTLRP